MAKGGLAKKQEEFESGQLDELEKASATAGHRDVFAKAKEVLHISDATEEKVKRALGEDHNVVFTDVFNKAREAAQREEADPDKAQRRAFRAAFEGVYGKVLFEQGGDDLEDYSGPVITKLKPVLKFAVDEKDGLKGRSELKVAMRRLRDAVKLRGPKYQTQIATHTADKQTKFDAAKTAREEVEGRVNEFDEAFNYLHALRDNLAKLGENFGEMEASVLENRMKIAELMASVMRELRKDTAITGGDVKTLAAQLLYELALIPYSPDEHYTYILNNLPRLEAAMHETMEPAAKAAKAELAKAKIEEQKAEKELTYANELTPETWLMDKAFPTAKSGAELERLGRLHHEAEHHEHDIQEVYKYFSDRTNAKKVVESSKAVGASIGEWTAFKEKRLTGSDGSGGFNKKIEELNLKIQELSGKELKDEAEISNARKEKRKFDGKRSAKQSSLEASDVKIKRLEKGIEAELDSDRRTHLETELEAAFEEKDKLIADLAELDEKIIDLESKLGLGTKGRLEAELAALEKEKGKIDLPINARISHIKEQIHLKESDTLSKFQIQDRLTKGLRHPGFDAIAEEKKLREDNERIAEERGKLKAELDMLELTLTKAKDFRDGLKTLIENAAKAEHIGIDLGVASGDEHHHFAAGLLTELQGIDLKNANFDPQKLVVIYEKFQGMFESDSKMDGLLERFDAAKAERMKATKEAKKALDKATAESEKGKNLTDASAAKRILGVLVAEAFPDMTMVEQAKFCTLQLARDVGKVQSQEGYMALARQGGAELLDTINTVGIRGKLISLKYKEKDTEVQPFKGLKPEDFKDWTNIEKLFDIGRLNHKNGFFALAALELLDREKSGDSDVSSVQTVRMKEKVRALFARDELKVSDELLEHSSVSAIVDEAFAKQLEKIRPLVAKHFGNYAKEGENSKAYMVEALNDEYKDLKDNLRDGVITPEVFEVKLKGLVKEAVEADVVGSVDFKQDEVAARYWNSKEAQWLRDRATDIGKSILRTGRDTLLYAPLKIGAWGMWGTAKAGASLGFNALLLPVRAAKYPLLMAGKIASAPINLFRKQPLTLPKLKETFTKDMYKVFNYSKEGINSNAKGAFSRVGTELKAGWGASKHKREEYSGRTKKKRELRTSKIKALREKAHVPVVEVAGSPFLDYSIYTSKISEAAKMLGVEYGGSGHGGSGVSVGPSGPAGKDEAGGGHGDDAGGHGKTEAHGKKGGHGD